MTYQGSKIHGWPHNTGYRHAAGQLAQTEVRGGVASTTLNFTRGVGGYCSDGFQTMAARPYGRQGAYSMHTWLVLLSTPDRTENMLKHSKIHPVSLPAYTAELDVGC